MIVTCHYLFIERIQAARATFRGDCDNKEKSPYGCCWDLSFKPNPNSGKKCPGKQQQIQKSFYEVMDVFFLPFLLGANQEACNMERKMSFKFL